MSLPTSAFQPNPTLSAVYAPALQRAIRSVEVFRPGFPGQLPGRVHEGMLHNPAVAVEDLPAAAPCGNAWTAPLLRAALALRTT